MNYSLSICSLEMKLHIKEIQMTEKLKRPRAMKLHVVTDADGKKVYVKAKTKTAALNYIIGNHFNVRAVAQKEMLSALDDISAGAEVHDANE